MTTNTMNHERQDAGETFMASLSPVPAELAHIRVIDRPREDRCSRGRYHQQYRHLAGGDGDYIEDRTQGEGKQDERDNSQLDSLQRVSGQRLRGLRR